jgi:hypothetical protein
MTGCSLHTHDVWIIETAKENAKLPSARNDFDKATVFIAV